MMLEIAVAASGLAIGYWLVNAFVSPPKLPDDPPHAEGAPETPDASRHWSEVLGVPLDADEAQVVAAWRRAIAQHHPDRVATMAPEIQALAKRRTTEINAAYDEAMHALRQSPR